MYPLSDFQKDLQQRLLQLLKADIDVKIVSFKDKTVGLNIVYDSFDFWIYDDEAMFIKGNKKHIFETPDFESSEDLKKSFLRRVSELL